MHKIERWCVSKGGRGVWVLGGDGLFCCGIGKKKKIARDVFVFR